MKLTIPIEPVPKARGRTVRKSGKTWTYTPEKTRVATEMVQWYAKEATRGEMPFVKHQPLAIDITFYVTKPKSVKREFPVVKPDIFNYLMLIADALQGIVYPDDAQIIGVGGIKLYGEPRIEIEIKEVE